VLAEEDVEFVLNSNALPRKGEQVFLVAASVYWGPPTTQPTHPDYFTVWAAAPATSNASNIFLHYTDTANNPSWSNSPAFEFVKHVDEFLLFRLQFRGRFPLEFVLLMESRTGGRFYDNNGGYGVNYRLHPHRGHASNVLVTNNIIAETKSFHVFSEIIPYKLVERPRF